VGNQKKICSFRALLFLTQKRSPRDSQTAQKPIERCTLGGQVKGEWRLRRARMSAVSLEAKIAMSPLEPRSKKRKVREVGAHL
jgi:hypothetical protein